MFAQAPDGWGWVVPVVVVLIYVLSYLWNALTGAAQKQNRPQPARGERPLPPPGQAQQPANAPPAEETVQSKLNAEIEEFLRRANERRADKNRRAAQPAQQQPEQPAPQPRQSKSKQEAAEKKKRRPRESFTQSVEGHLGADKFGAREQQLADDVTRAELEMSQHVHEVFEHRLGSLGETTAEGQPTSGETKATRSAEQQAEALAVAGLFVNPENLRRAVILREILERPIDRW